MCFMTQIRPETRDAIVEAAFTIFAEDPSASLGDVAKRAGVGRATLHRHFPGRPELMRALAKIALTELEEATAQAAAEATTYEEGFRLALHAMVPLANRQWFLTRESVEADPEVAAAHAASRDDLRGSIEAAKADGLFDRDVPTEWIVASYEHLTYVAWSFVRAGEATPKQAADLAWRTFFTGLKGRST